MTWTHGQNERRETTEKIRDKEARLQKTRMGIFSGEKCREKNGRKRPATQRVIEENESSSCTAI